MMSSVIDCNQLDLPVLFVYISPTRVVAANRKEKLMATVAVF